PAAMEDVAIEGDDASGGYDDCIAGVVAGIADQVVGAVFLSVVDDAVLGSATRVGQQVDGAVFFADVVQRAPAGHIGFVLGRGVVPLHVAGVLVPGELHTL